MHSGDQQGFHDDPSAGLGNNISTHSMEDLAGTSKEGDNGALHHRNVEVLPRRSIAIWPVCCPVTGEDSQRLDTIAVKLAGQPGHIHM
jgi:hypothetical protein